MNFHGDTTPRVRGLRKEALSRVSLNDTAPRVRDTRGVTCSIPARYSPACAGLRCCASRQKVARRIQPRVCGDYLLVVYSVIVVADTTPRVRGLLLANRRRRYFADTAPRVRGLQKFCGRIVVIARYNPACAGTTRCTRFSPVLIFDTTPRVRGLQIADIGVVDADRYNPACAGTTPHGRRDGNPRVRDYEKGYFSE